MIVKHKRDLVGLVQLEDLDFNDDLTLLASNHNNMQEKSDRLVKYVKQVPTKQRLCTRAGLGSTFYSVVLF